MAAILENIRTLLPIFLGSWVVFLLLTFLRPQRFSNSFVLLFTLAITLLFFCGLFGDWSGSALIICFLVICLALFFVPVMLIWNGTVMCKKESRSPGNLLSLIFGVVIAIGEIAAVISVFGSVYDYAKGVFGSVVTLLFLSIFYFSVWILAFVLYIFFIQWMPHRMKFDYVIIHGCGLLEGERISKLLASRLEKAIEIYEKCREKPILIPCGGRGRDESRSEAEAMTEYLVARGIAIEQIRPEDASTTTRENLINSKKIIDAGEGGHRTALVSSNYHIYRCMLYARRLKLKCTGIGSEVAWYFWPSATLREFAAVFSKPPHIVFLILGYLLCVGLPTLLLLGRE